MIFFFSFSLTIFFLYFKTESKQYFFDMEAKNDNRKRFGNGNDRQHKKPKVQQWDQGNALLYIRM